jgi:hypothetical protein
VYDARERGRGSEDDEEEDEGQRGTREEKGETRVTTRLSKTQRKKKKERASEMRIEERMLALSRADRYNPPPLRRHSVL